MTNKQKHIKLRLSLNTINQGFFIKKTLFASLIATSITIGVVASAYSQDLTTLQFTNSTAINQLRTYYASPAKSLNKIIQKAGKTRQELPAYSQKTGKAYVIGKYSETKKVSNNKKEKGSVFNWLSLEGKYSKFFNDPFYNTNKQNSSITKFDSNKNIDYTKYDTSVARLKVNNKLAYQFEVIVWPDGTVSVPIKTLAEILDVPTEQNHATNNINFKQPGTDENVSIELENNRILVGSSIIEIKNPNLLYVKDGFIVKDDIFIPEQLARDLLDFKSSFTTESYTMSLDTSRVLKALVEKNEVGESSQFVLEGKNNIVNAQKENKLLNIKKLNYNIGSSTNQNYYGYGNNSNSSAYAGFNATGNLFGGEYNIGASTYYNKYGLQLSNYRASLDYIRPNYELSLGGTNLSVSDMIMPSSTIWGFRFGSVGAASGNSIPRLIRGKAEDNSMVEIFVNGVYADKQLVQNGKFEFDSLRYPTNSIVHITVEQVGQDGNRKIVYDRKFSQDKDLLAPGQKQYLVFSGIDASALSNNITLFGDTFNSGYLQPVKWVSGGKFRMGLSENLTVGINYAKDIIIRQPSKLLLNNLRYLTSARTYRSARSSSGQLITFDFDYAATKNLRISSEFGFSNAKSTVDPDFDPNGIDFGGYIGFDYNKNNFSLSGMAFNYGSDFYPNGSLGLIDRRGIQLSSNWSIGRVNFNGNITRYNSNLDNYFIGGNSSVMDCSLYASGQIDEYSDVRAGISYNGAENALYTDKTTTFDITLNRKLSNKANLTLNYAKTLRTAKSPNMAFMQNNSNSRINANLNYDAGKLGVIRLSHEMMTLDPVDRILLGEVNQDYFINPVYSKNIRITLDRSNKPIKGFTFSPNVGYRYGGQDKGLNFGLNLGYMFKSGRQIVLSYAYNSCFARYMPGAFSFGGSKSHSVSFNFVDSIGFGKFKNKNNNIYQSSIDANSGIVKGKVFLDLNQNGIQDPGEEGLSGIDIGFQDLLTVSSDKEGNYIAANIPTGLRKIGLDKNTLPVIYTPTVADALVNIRKEKVYVANFGVIVTPGNITGKIFVNAEGKTNKDVVILLLDKKGKEFKYTTTDSTGTYNLAAIPPGEYIIVVDKNYLNLKELQESTSEPHKIVIPMVTDDFVDIKDINISLVNQKREVKKF